MKTLKIDEKWSVEYDPENNDRPTAVLRYGEQYGEPGVGVTPYNWTSQVRAMFYALLKAKLGKTVSDFSVVPDYVALCKSIHADNVKAGWWTDLATGASSLHARNRPEMLMLAVSELAEADYGCGEDDVGLMDDKLPHLPMYSVELADFAIRLLDQIGAEIALGAEQPIWNKVPLGSLKRASLRSVGRREGLMGLVCNVSTSMEHYRTGRTRQYVQSMANAVMGAFFLAKGEEVDLLDIIAQKRAFNAKRADHKIENRLKEGGKAF